MALGQRKDSHLHLTIPDPAPIEHWWEGGSSPGSIDEGAEYDCGYLNLGAESPSLSTPGIFQDPAFVQKWAAAGRVLSRRPSSRMLRDRASLKKDKDSVDRDCGICFEYAVVPCRTLCCGKIFCTEHLADWLHGPNAEGRCPNCENACSLEGGTLSLAPPVLAAPRPKPGVHASSPLISLQLHQNGTLKQRDPHTIYVSDEPSDFTSSSSSSCTVSSSEESSPQPSDTHTFGFGPSTSIFNASSSSTTTVAASWGAVSRLISIATFLVFLYRLLS